MTSLDPGSDILFDPIVARIQRVARFTDDRLRQLIEDVERVRTDENGDVPPLSAEQKKTLGTLLNGKDAA